VGAQVIPFYQPPRLSDLQTAEIQLELGNILGSGQLTNGRNVRELEEKVAELHKVDHVVACSSATQAMWIVLKTLNVKTVLIQAFTWKSLSYIIPARVKYCDVNADTWLMTPTGTKSASTVIATHTFGNTVVMDKPQKATSEIYDGAYSLGADLPEIGTATVISLTASKTVTSCEGGLILTNSKGLAHACQEVRDKCSRMSEVNAVIGLAYLQMLKDVLTRKRNIFNYYNSHLLFKSQKASPYGTNYGFYGCLVPNRTQFMEKLQNKLELRIRYAPLIQGLPITDEIAQKIVLLPCYSDLDPATVVNQINEVTEKWLTNPKVS
jgi:dTDP-4-amino-4,6-dideoxygalactose transaminase